MPALKRGYARQESGDREISKRVLQACHHSSRLFFSAVRESPFGHHVWSLIDFVGSIKNQVRTATIKSMLAE